MEKLTGMMLISFAVLHAVYSQGPVAKNEMEACKNFCKDSMDMAMVEHCERGCRLAELVQASPTLELNSSSAQNLCYDSCKEAYVTPSNKVDACSRGCEGNIAVDDVMEDEDLSEVMEVMEKEAKKFDLITSYILSQLMRGMPLGFREYSQESGMENQDANLNIPYLDDALNKPNSKDMFDVELEVDVLAKDGEDFLIISNDGNHIPPPHPRNSVIISMYGFLTAVFFTTFLISVCFMVTRCLKARKTKVEYYTEEKPDSPPPSYKNIYKGNSVSLPEYSNMKAPLVENAVPFDELQSKLEDKLNVV